MSAIDVLARTIYGEARGEGEKGMIAVANVIMNRAAKGGWWGSTIEDVCKKPWQFSCWNKNDPNREKLERLTEDDPLFCECLGIAALVIAHRKQKRDTEYNPRTFPSDCFHYCTKQLYEKSPPDWAKNRMHDFAIHHHYFFCGVE